MPIRNKHGRAPTVVIAPDVRLAFEQAVEQATKGLQPLTFKHGQKWRDVWPE